METTSPSKDKGLGTRLLEKMLMPIVATASSAAAAYAAKRAPKLIDEKVTPKLRELLGAAARRRAVAATRNGHRHRPLPPAELEQRLDTRAKHRAARRRSSR